MATNGKTAFSIEPVVCTICGTRYQVADIHMNLSDHFHNQNYNPLVEQGSYVRIHVPFGGALFGAQVPVVNKPLAGIAAEDLARVTVFRREYQAYIERQLGFAFDELESYLSEDPELAAASKLSDEQALAGLERCIALGAIPDEADKKNMGRELIANIPSLPETLEMQAAWYTISENGRVLPGGLAVLGRTVNNVPVVKQGAASVCPHCASSLPEKFGAYRQRFIGVLGTQSTGKTSYLCALADRIRAKEVCRTARDNGRMIIDYSASGDEQWQRFIKDLPSRDKAARGEPETAEEEAAQSPGPLACYRHGYGVEKTNLQGNIFSLTFKVDPLVAGREPVLYTLVDMPGEAFATPDRLGGAINMEHFSRCQTILNHCDAFMIVAAVSQLNGTDKTLIDDYNVILQNAEKLIPQHDNPPIAVVLTKCDLLGGGGLEPRKQLRLGYPLTEVRLFGSNIDNKGNAAREKRDFFFVELARHVSGCTQIYLNENAGGFVDTVLRLSKGEPTAEGKRKRVSFFPVSAYGQEVEPYNPTARMTDEQEALVYDEMRAKRFMVDAPFLWILTCFGELPCGYPEDEDIRDIMPQDLKDVEAELIKKLYIYE